MKFFKAAPTVLFLDVLGVAFSTNSRADETNRKTVITFSGPVEIPGVHLQGFGILPAGSDRFKIRDAQSDRHVFQIFRLGGRKLSPAGSIRADRGARNHSIRRLGG